MSPPGPCRPLRLAPPRPIRREGGVRLSRVSTVPLAPPGVATILGAGPILAGRSGVTGGNVLPSAPGFGYNPHSS
jgi:hypothetical protein